MNRSGEFVKILGHAHNANDYTAARLYDVAFVVNEATAAASEAIIENK
jgi:hypothetical protein